MASVAIDSVVTTDYAPAVAPHRISAKATKNRVTVAITPTSDALRPSSTNLFPSAKLKPPFVPGSGGLVPGPGLKPKHQPILAVRYVLGGTTPYNGTLVSRKGLVCSSELPCSDALPCSEWAGTHGQQIVEHIDYPEVAPHADGSVTVNIWVNFRGVWI